MSKFIFPLKKPLVGPLSSDENDPRGYFVFPKSIFGLSYDVIQSPKQKTTKIVLMVVRVSDELVCQTLRSFDITERGFSTGTFTNQTEIDEYNEALSNLKSRYEASLKTIQKLEQEFLEILGRLPQDPSWEKDLEKKEKAVAVAKTSISDILSQLNTLQNNPIVPQEIFVNTYNEVLSFFNPDGSITDDGIEWAKNLDIKPIGKIGLYI